MDRFTGFHLLSQEMIELIVRVRESSSDIQYLVDETDQVARSLRQVTTQLQEGMTKSRMYMNGTLRSWIHYIQLRSGNGTQKEHREVALACAKAIDPIFPMIKEFVDGQS
jgi:hypothetical protein